MRVVAWLCEASPFYQYASIPHPAPEGRGQSWRYPGKGRTRGVSPDIGPWGIYTRGGYTPVGTSPRGWGRWGGGKKPPPLSLLSICQHPPPRPARRASSPAPGGGGSRGDTPGKGRTRESEPTHQFFLQSLPIPWTVGTSPRGVGQTGRGQKAPSPVSAFNMSASLLSPGRDSAGDTRGKAVPGRANPHTSSFFRFSPCAGPWGHRPGGGADGAGASLLSPGGVAPGEPEEHPPRISRMQGDMVQWFGAQRSPSLQKKSHKRVESSSESSSTSSKQASPPSRRRGALPQSTSSGTS